MTAQQLLLFLKTYDFRKGILFAALGFGVFLGGSYLFPHTPFPIAMGMGILLSAISDVPGTKKHNLIGIAIGILFSIISFSLVHLTIHNQWLLLLTITVLVFTFSYFSVYGLRASMVSFSGILAVALGFVNIGPDAELYKSSLFIVVGSLVYILVSTIINLIKPKQITEQLLVECMQLTADYLKIRGQIPLTKNRKPLLNKLLALQISINEKHENIRGIVLRDKASVMGSGFARRQLLIFVELVDILELAIANPVNYDAIDEKFKEHPQVLVPFANLLNTSSNLLKELSFKISHKSIASKSSELRTILAEINEAIATYKQSIDADYRRENVLLLRNLADYEDRQIQKIETIERIIADDFQEAEIGKLEPQRFIPSQDYSLKRLRDNFNFRSIIFKHALRHTLTVIAGFLIGTYFEIQNTYWILITIFVIMRPNYGVTKKRTSERVLGTVLGALISFGIIYFTNNHYIYGVVTFFAMIFAFTYIQRDYFKAATAITINIIFIFAILTTNPFEIISSRILDTIIGAALAMIFNYFLWPVWEASTFSNFLKNSLKANEKYIQEIAALYIDKNRSITEYKLSRKTAFIQMGNLHAAFQRMTQEPKSKQKTMPKLYEVIVIQHTFLSAAAALGTYIRGHETTEASEQFKLYIEGILARLHSCSKLLNKATATNEFDFQTIDKANQYLANIYTKLEEQREAELAAGQVLISKKLQTNLKEIKLVHDQLSYLYNLSKDLESNIEKFAA